MDYANSRLSLLNNDEDDELNMFSVNESETKMDFVNDHKNELESQTKAIDVITSKIENLRQRIFDLQTQVDRLELERDGMLSQQAIDVRSLILTEETDEFMDDAGYNDLLERRKKITEHYHAYGEKENHNVQAPTGDYFGTVSCLPQDI